jgi:hypothetical protein
MSLIFAKATDATDSWRISYRDIIGHVRINTNFRGSKEEAEAEIIRLYGSSTNPDKSAYLTPLNNYTVDKVSRREEDDLSSCIW